MGFECGVHLTSKTRSRDEKTGKRVSYDKITVRSTSLSTVSWLGLSSSFYFEPLSLSAPLVCLCVKVAFCWLHLVSIRNRFYSIEHISIKKRRFTECECNLDCAPPDRVYNLKHKAQNRTFSLDFFFLSLATSNARFSSTDPLGWGFILNFGRSLLL